MLASSLLKDKVIGGAFPGAENLAFHVTFASLAVIAASSRDGRVHVVLASTTALLVATYIALLFSVLR